jgi:hypothetical protein
MRSIKSWGHGSRLTAVVAMLCIAMLTVGVTGADAKGGTAKPPQGTVAPVPQATLSDPGFTGDPAGRAALHGVDVTGFIQDAHVTKPADADSSCPKLDQAHQGGTVTLNNTVVTVPCNLIVQMPANTLTWNDFLTGGTLPVTLKDSPFPSFEIRAVGNTVLQPDGRSTKRIAGLMYASQQSVAAGSGFITGFDYAHGRVIVDGNGTGPTVVEINDPATVPTADPAKPTGRHSAGQSPDERFSVDQANPTIHAGTGYPMCIPRTGDNTTSTPGADPLCPQQNRPTAASGCRNFSQAAIPLPASGELSRPAAGQIYCTQFVMAAPPVKPTDPAVGPDSRQQAPFEVGDYVNFSGTLVHDPNGGPDYISAHTIEANLGIYTQPKSKPSYVAIGGFGIGTADPAATAVNGAAQETQDRLFLEAETTDLTAPVDIYLTDTDPTTGGVRNRWVTPFEMTGENQTGNPSGGITTQFKGPQPQRARIRATKAPSLLLSDPSRTIRISNRDTCTPTQDTRTINVTTGAVPPPGAAGTVDDCLNNPDPATYGIAANGLSTGQYTAPVFEYIFPENVKPGDTLVPNDLWHLGFLRFGEGANNPIGPPTGPLTPAPW